jgi:hypothetical protein
MMVRGVAQVKGRRLGLGGPATSPGGDKGSVFFLSLAFVGKISDG